MPNENAISAEATWRQALTNLKVVFIWAYDTIAILDIEDYYDAEEGILPAGQLIRCSIGAENPAEVICDLDDPRTVEKLSLPKGRVLRLGWLGWRATRLQAVVSLADYQNHTVAAERLSWLRRLTRRLGCHAA